MYNTQIEIYTLTSGTKNRYPKRFQPLHGTKKKEAEERS